MIIMQNISQLEEIKGDKPITIVLGNFDGVHLGHQKLIKVATVLAKETAGETCLLTFYPPPQLLFNPEFKMINSLEFKIDLIRKLGIDKLVAIPFTKSFSEIEPEQFINEIIDKKVRASNIVCGFNYSFGHKGSGRVEDLVKLATNLMKKVVVMEPFYIDNELVSSTRIRQLIASGDLSGASKLLGYSPRLKGKVIHGNKIGTKLGFPTANIAWDKNLLIPGTGVYAVSILVGDREKQGVANIGYRPTVTQEKTLNIEINIFNFNEDIYDQEIQIIFHTKLRGEATFQGLDQLKAQIARDAQKAQEYFGKKF